MPSKHMQHFVTAAIPLHIVNAKLLERSGLLFSSWAVHAIMYNNGSVASADAGDFSCFTPDYEEQGIEKEKLISKR